MLPQFGACDWEIMSNATETDPNGLCLSSYIHSMDSQLVTHLRFVCSSNLTFDYVHDDYEFCHVVDRSEAKAEA